MNKFKKQIVSFVILLLVFAAPVLALAQTDYSPTDYLPENMPTLIQQDESQSITKTVSNIINVVLGVLGLIAVIIVLIGGFKWMTANGSEDKVTDAKNTIKYGLIGLAIVLLAYIIVQVVMSAVIKLGQNQTQDL